MRQAILLLWLPILVACGELSGEEAPDRGAPGLPTALQSVVYGPAEQPAGGTLVVGHLVPMPPARHLVDLIGGDSYARFLAEEQARAEREDAEEGAEEEIEEIYEEDFDLEGRTATSRARTAFRSAVAEAVRARENVAVIFRDVLPLECAGLPLVIADQRDLTPGEIEALRPWIEAGGVLARDREEVTDVGQAVPGIVPQAATPDAILPLVAACQEAIRTSPFVRRLAVDPRAVRGAQREGDDLVVEFAGRPVEATLRGPDDALVRPAAIEEDGVVRVAAPDPALDPFQHRLVVRWQEGDLTLWRAFTVRDLVGTVDRLVLAPRRVEAGSSYAPHVLFTNDRTGDPVSGRPETLRLLQQGRILAEATGKSTEAGGLDLVLAVPADASPGPAVLMVGRDEFPVVVQSTLRVSAVTDRALYRPDDLVHVRVMVHDAARGAPAADREVLLRRGDVEQRVRTSTHGIAAAHFRLVDERPGPAQILVACCGAEADATFRIQAFETPTFLATVEPPSLELHPGEEAPVRLSCRYVNAAPMVGARVDVRAEGAADVSPSELETDADGRAEVLVHLGRGAGPAQVLLVVRDADGRTQTVVVPVVRVTEPSDRPTLAVEAVEDLAEGLPGRLEVRGAPHESLNARVGETTHAVVLDEQGRAQLEVLPASPTLGVRLERADGDVLKTNLEVASPGDEPARPVLLTDRRIARVGEVLHLRLRGAPGLVVLQVGRDDTVLRSRAVLLRDETVAVDLPLDDDLAGDLEVSAIGGLGSERLPGTVTHVLVLRDRSLRVRARTLADAYRPAETARVEVDVRDRAGNPTAAVLGYWGVDEALLALQPWHDGYEDVFDLAPWGPDFELVAAAERGASPSYRAARALLGRVAARGGHDHCTCWDLEIRHHLVASGSARARTQARERFEAALEASREAWLASFASLPLEDVCTSSSLREQLVFLMGRGALVTAALLDPWGTPLELGHGEASDELRFERQGSWTSWEDLGVGVTSAGPDRAFGTPDDLTDVWPLPDASEIGGRLGRFLRFVESVLRDRAESDAALEELLEEELADAPFTGPAHNRLIGLGGGAGGAFRGRGGHRTLGGGGGGKLTHVEPPVHVRKDFQPTLCFVPEAIVGPDGRLLLDIPLKDAITTWRLRLVASAASGATGIGEGSIRVTQPLHVEPWVATHLTVGDVLELPVAVRNERPDSFDAHVTASAAGGLVVLGAAAQTVSVGPRGTGVVVFRLRAAAPGKARVRIDARAGTHADAVERVVHIRPDARADVETFHATLEGGRPWRPDLAAAASDLPREHQIKVYTSPLATLIGGLEGVITCPHG